MCARVRISLSVCECVRFSFAYIHFTSFARFYCILWHKNRLFRTKKEKEPKLHRDAFVVFSFFVHFWNGKTVICQNISKPKSVRSELCSFILWLSNAINLCEKRWTTSWTGYSTHTKFEEIVRSFRSTKYANYDLSLCGYRKDTYVYRIQPSKSFEMGFFFHLHFDWKISWSSFGVFFWFL